MRERHTDISRPLVLIGDYNGDREMCALYLNTSGYGVATAKTATTLTREVGARLRSQPPVVKDQPRISPDRLAQRVIGGSTE